MINKKIFFYLIKPITIYSLRLTFIITISCTSFLLSQAQEVFYHISNRSVYDFLDEMANIHLIELNTAATPYSRVFIANKLNKLSEQTEKLNTRQKKDLEFFLKDFNKELLPNKHFKKRFDIFYYKDSLFTFSIDPIVGIQYWSNENGSATHWWNGLELFSYIGKHLGIYANIRDNHDKEYLSNPEYLNQQMGANYKSGGDYSEMRGGITWSWKWGSAGLIKDHFVWGNNYNGANIFSGRTPSFGQIYLNLKPVH